MKALEHNLFNLHGDAGKKWLEALPSQIKLLKSKHGLSDLKSVGNLSYNYVLRGMRGNLPIILKLSFRADELKHEAEILEAYAHTGGVKVLFKDTGLLMQECAVPGTPLSFLFPHKEHETIAIAAEVIKRLHTTSIACEHKLEHIKNWLTILDSKWPIESSYLHKARTLRENLLKSTTHEVLLHGDLHQDNILKNGDDWVVIDPKGVIGDPVYELGAFIRNPMNQLLNQPDLHAILLNRIKYFSQLMNLCPQRIKQWCFVQSVLAWIWTLEDNGDETYFKKLTQHFEDLLNV